MFEDFLDFSDGVGGEVGPGFEFSDDFAFGGGLLGVMGDSMEVILL